MLRGVVGAVIVALMGGVSSAWAGPDDARAFIADYCVSCHNARVKVGGLTLDGVNLADVAASAPLLERVVKKVEGRLMPPAGSKRPPEAQYQAFLGWLEGALTANAAQHPNAGRTETFHRLNRAEYRNVIRDVLALDIDVAALLPADSGSYGFDNVAGTLKLDQALLERYLAAADQISKTALGRPVAPASVEFRLPNDFPQDQHVEGLPLGTRGGLSVRHTFPLDGEYLFAVDLMCGSSNAVAVCDGSGGWADTHELDVSVDGRPIKTFVLEPAPFGSLRKDGWSIRVPVKAGPRTVTVTFVAPPEFEEVESNYLRFRKPVYLTVANTVPALATYQPAVAALTLTGPFSATGPGDTPSRRAILSCTPASPTDRVCARRILTSLARRAYRRPPVAADLETLLVQFDDAAREEGFEAGIEAALQRMLVSPQFLFRIEADRPADPSGSYALTDLELASRLSFFLWSSVPDQALMTAALRGQLRQPAVLDAQVTRMLRDPKSQAFIENFAGQWLQLRNLEARSPSDFLFPNFDHALRLAFRTETELFFSSIVHDDRSALDLLSANYTFVNERLARHYGIPNVKGSRFVRVTLPEESPRRGLLGQGSVLLVTSHAIRTSPVLRGKWILENILGTPPPAPPDNVPALKEKEAGSRATVLSVRDRMAQHRANPVCASCHAMIDPPGFALENFDAVGQWRDVDESRNAIDASGVLPDGSKFANLAEFRALLLARPERFVTTLTEKLFVYGLGRGLDPYDMPRVRAVVRDARTTNYRFSSLVRGVVASPAFQRRQALPAGGRL